MFDLILNVAEKDKGIRAVYMTGTRTNPNASKDIFKDYRMNPAIQCIEYREILTYLYYNYN